jgi:tRNA U34 2-thiouridine synthase MnmA/TrmU
MLAAQLLRGQEIEVLALFFETPFFPSARARESARSIRLPLKVIDITERHLEVVKRPKYGYGGNMNPCLDCHALMLRAAGEMLQPEDARFIITGEVLGQRPMSQNKKALGIVARESGYEGLILRPLSAKRLPLSVPEKMGWVDRDRLMDFSGRSRKPQSALAEKLGIRDYPTPAGGCLLTDEAFSRRLKDLLSSSAPIAHRDLELLKLGRHFRLTADTKLIVGRNQTENQAIQSLSGEEDTVLKPISVPGPTVLVLGELPSEMVDLAASFVASYGDAPDNELTVVRLTRKGGERVVKVSGTGKDVLRKYIL